MHRIDTATAEADKHGTGKDGYTNGVVPTTPPTQCDDDALDSFQEEIIGPIEHCEITLDKTNFAQLLMAIDFMVARGILWDNWPQVSTATEIYGSGLDETTYQNEFRWVGAGGLVTKTNDNFSSTSTVTGPSATLHDIESNGTDWIAVGVSENVWKGSVGGATMAVQSTPGSDDLYGIVWGESLWVAVGDSGKVITSADGVTWTARTSNTAENLRAVAYGNGIFVAVGENGEVITSPDGVTAWTDQTNPHSNNWNDLIFYNGLFIGVELNYIWTSPDGVTWTQRMFQTGVGGTGPWGASLSHDSVGVAIMTGGVGGGQGTTVYISPDGLEWFRLIGAVSERANTEESRTIGYTGAGFFAGGELGEYFVSSNYRCPVVPNP